MGDGRLGLLGERLLSRSDLCQRGFPPALELPGNEPVIGIDTVELPFGQRRGLSFSFELTFRAGAQRGVDLLLGLARPRQGVELDRGQCDQEGFRHDLRLQILVPEPAPIQSSDHLHPSPQCLRTVQSKLGAGAVLMTVLITVASHPSSTRKPIQTQSLGRYP
jgi:hypothetical protein